MRRELKPDTFTPAMGAYSHGVSVNVGDKSFIFVTGQLAIDPDSNVVSDDISAQTRYVFENVSRILEEGGASIDDVVKAQIFVTDMGEFAKISAVRNEYFAKARPVSTLVEVTALARDGCRVELEVIAIIDS